MNISFKSRLLFIALTSLVMLTYSALVKAECIDSPLQMIPAESTTAQNCEDLVNNVPICTTEISSHCPLSCNACTEFECSDSDATFIYGGEERNCTNAEILPPEFLAQICQVTRLAQTCRDLCDYCNTAVPSTGPSSAPSVTPTFLNLLIDMNFDEVGLDCDGPFDDYDYSYYYDDGDDCDNIDYYHPDITLVNFGYYPGHFSPGTGYDYGVVTPENVSFNKYGEPVIIRCTSGSFYIDSIYVTSAWQPNAPVDFIGVKNDGTTLDFSITLPNITTTILLDSEFDEFTDLVEIVINTPRDGDLAVMDDIQIGITTQCDMTEELEEGSFVHPMFWPIYPLTYSG